MAWYGMICYVILSYGMALYSMLCHISYVLLKRPHAEAAEVREERDLGEVLRLPGGLDLRSLLAAIIFQTCVLCLGVYHVS